MIKIENDFVFGWESAIRGMRNPMNSWDKSDSHICCGGYKVSDANSMCAICPKFDGTLCSNNNLSRFMVIGDNDLKLMKSLVKAGLDHSKFMRMINVTLDITAPLYWWKEFDTYKVGTVRNSCSTMHKIHSKEFTIDDFSYEHLATLQVIFYLINELNFHRKKFLETNHKHYWWQMIQLLPSSYNQRATVQLNYAVLRNMYHSRKNHKLDEWRDFCKWIETLPYAKQLICCE